VKVAVIGGGSTYTPELIDGILQRHERLPVSVIHLVDIDLTRLTIIAAFARPILSGGDKGFNRGFCYLEWRFN
jgi:6-phospho-beta-glucosidase